ncbi:MAG: M20/M25/M40 family metallo-hydrolase [Firmicutes bacterium]|nr:M20/M25/M40 family metallo-hydrolase [Bacillota bacterium]
MLETCCFGKTNEVIAPKGFGYNKAIRTIIEEFRAICAIPHGSGFEKDIGEHLKKRLTSLGAEVHKDETGNILGIIQGQEGREDVPAIILQAHMDMVIAGDKKPEEAVVNPVIEEDSIKSDGHTTLGADNGIGLATILSLIKLKEKHYGPIKVLFTVSEEIGLKGAKAVPESWLSGAKYMINTDGFHSDTEVIGCKGGLRETFSRQLQLEKIKDKVSFNTRKKNQLEETELYEVKMEGFLGGHSGDDIDKHRCNSIHQLAEILEEVQDRFDMRIVQFKGGVGYNAIPGDATAIVAVPMACRLSAGKLLLKEEKHLHQEYERSDPTGRLTVKRLGETSKGSLIWNYDFQRDVLYFLTHLHDGITSVDKEGEVTSSSNLGKVFTQDGFLYVGDMLRCDTIDQENHILDMHRKTAGESGFELSVAGYHSWHSLSNSRLADTINEIYQEHHGVPMRKRVAKVGLEPAFFQELAPEMEIVCLGAEILNAHSVKERVIISSIGVLYSLIAETLRRIWRA